MIPQSLEDEIDGEGDGVLRDLINITDFDREDEDTNSFIYDTSTSGIIKDDDSVKLFIGQIPKDMDEDELRPYFEEFGQIFELTIIRDKATKVHRGCAFLTYCQRSSAALAIEQLHDKFKLPNAMNFLQVRPAESQAERENKLFIGMLPKNIAEDELNSIFSQFGELREIHVIRGPDGNSKGCAFIKFMDRDAAMVAIEVMHDSIPEGSTRPLVVKFADNKKLIKSRNGGMSTSPTSSPGGPIISSSASPAPGQSDYWSSLPPIQQQQHQRQSMSAGSQYPFGGYSGSNVNGSSGNNQSTQPMMPMPYMTTTYPNPAGANQSYIYYQSPMSPMPMYTPYGAHNTAYPSSPIPSSDPSTTSHPHPQSQGIIAQQPMMQHHHQQQFRPPIGHLGSMMDSSSTTSSHSRQPSGQSSSGRPAEGPSGANLFIYHLPRDLTDADLATLFASFGNVISAKVYVDKKTTESKGFGFVSYDSVSSAEEAINTMNGFQIGSKRLKVQHKRSGGSGMMDMNMAMGMAMGMGGGGVSVGVGGGGAGGDHHHPHRSGQMAMPSSGQLSMPYPMMSMMPAEGMEYFNRAQGIPLTMPMQQLSQHPLGMQMNVTASTPSSSSGYSDNKAIMYQKQQQQHAGGGGSTSGSIPSSSIMSHGPRGSVQQQQQHLQQQRMQHQSLEEHFMSMGISQQPASQQQQQQSQHPGTSGTGVSTDYGGRTMQHHQHHQQPQQVPLQQHQQHSIPRGQYRQQQPQQQPYLMQAQSQQQQQQQQQPPSQQQQHQQQQASQAPAAEMRYYGI